MGVGKRQVPVGSTVAVSVVPPAMRVPVARRRERPSAQATISAPAVRPSQQSTIAVPAVPASADAGNRGAAVRNPKRTILAMTQRSVVLGMDVVEEIPIDIDDLEDDPEVVTEAQGRIGTQPYRVTIGTRTIEERPGPQVWIVAMTVAGLAAMATILVAL